MKQFLFLLAFVIFLLSSKSLYAQVIQTGDAKAEVTVETNTSGGESYTKIEIEANGEKKVLETTEQGTHKLEINTEGSMDENISPSATITPKEDSKEANNSKKNINFIFESFKNWLNKLFSIFNLF